MKYERKHKVGIDEVNNEFLMTNKALIVVFENAMSFYADKFGFGILDVVKTNLTWFVVDWKVKVLKRPKYGDKLIIRTWGRDPKDCFMYTDFEVYVNDELYVQATTKMALFNVKTTSLESIPKKVLRNFVKEDSTFKERELKHMVVLDKYDDISEIVIRKSDLDFNRHVNNVRYFDYLADYFDYSDFNDFRITYRKEIKEEDNISLYHSKRDNIDYFAIKDDKDNVKTIIECY